MASAKSLAVTPRRACPRFHSAVLPEVALTDAARRGQSFTESSDAVFRTLILSLQIRTKDTQTGGCNVRAADASNPRFHTLTFTVCGDAVPADGRGQAFYCLHQFSFDLYPCEKGPAGAKEIYF